MFSSKIATNLVIISFTELIRDRLQHMLKHSLANLLGTFKESSNHVIMWQRRNSNDTWLRMRTNVISVILTAACFLVQAITADLQGFSNVTISRGYPERKNNIQ